MSRDGQSRGNGSVRALVGTFPMPAGTVFERHTHDRHQLVWAASGVVLTAVGERQWVLPQSRALWVPAGVPHATSASGRAVLRSVYVDPGRTTIRWTEPTPVEAPALVGELVNRLGAEGLTAAQRRRTEAVLLDVLVPVAVATVGPSMPEDPRAREVAEGLLAEPGTHGPWRSGAARSVPAHAPSPGRSPRTPGWGSAAGAPRCGCRQRCGCSRPASPWAGSPTGWATRR